MENITAVTVLHNTPELFDKALTSLYEFYPDIDVIVVDGSTKSYNTIHTKPKFVKFGFNIGHGNGMNVGITLCNTEYILIFDTDIEVFKPPIKDMLKMFRPGVFAVGQINNVPQKTYGINIKYGTDIPVVHPYFHIINRYEYMKYLPYIHSGGPTCLTSIDIYEKGLSHRVLVDFPVKDYVKHDWRGTRDLYVGTDLFSDQVKPTDYF